MFLTAMAKLKGGETWGPGALEFSEDYSTAESDSLATISMKRKNGSLGMAAVRFKTVAKSGIAGVANPGSGEDILDPESTSDFVDTQQLLLGHLVISWTRRIIVRISASTICDNWKARHSII